MTTSPRYHHIVAAYSVSAAGNLVLERAIDLARRNPGYALHVIHAIDAHAGTPLVGLEGKPDYVYADAVQAALADLVVGRITAQKIPAPHEIHFNVHARIGKPAEQVLHLARELGAELILVGSHDHSRLERALVGSTSNAIVRGAACSVLVVRPREEGVKLAEITDAPHGEHHPHHARQPHRYTYHDDIVTHRPADWPLF
jgi:nucleotide-binding universal stress UspA family protein